MRRTSSDRSRSDTAKLEGQQAMSQEFQPTQCAPKAPLEWPGLRCIDSNSKKRKRVDPPSAHANTGPSNGGLVDTLLKVHSSSDVLKELEGVAAHGDAQILRDLHRSTAAIQEAIRKVQSKYGVDYWLPLYCHCNSRVNRWALGDTTCSGNKSKRNFRHKLLVERVKCTSCNKDWKLETLSIDGARRRGCWHPHIDKHCTNPSCEYAKGGKAFKCASCPARKGGPVHLR